jgi:hypothetical protein
MMVRKLKTHSGDVEFFDNDFSVSTTRFNYSSVERIKSVHKATKYMLYGVINSGTAHTAVLDVYIREQRDPIKIRFRGSFFRTTSFTYEKDDVEHFVNCSNELRGRTFSTRLARYIDQIKNNGYFVYGKMRFARDLRVYDDTGAFLFDMAKCSHHQGYNVRRWVDKEAVAERARWSALRRYTSPLRGWYDISTAFDSEVLDELILDLFRNYVRRV